MSLRLVLLAWLLIGDPAQAHQRSPRLEKPPAWACWLIRQEAQRFESRPAAIRAARSTGLPRPPKR